MNSILSYLKNKKLIWHGSTLNEAVSGNTLTGDQTGFSELDVHLPGGFPNTGVIDIRSPVGIGELRLLLPLLHRRQENSSKLLVLVAPPMQVNSEMFAEFGLQLTNILLIQPQTPKQALWAAEQCLKSGSCHSVVMWHKALEVHQVKRLQVASAQGGAVQITLRDQAFDCLPLPVTLAMQLSPDPMSIKVKITKRKGAWPSPDFQVNMASRWPELSILPAKHNILPFPHSNVG